MNISLNSTSQSLRNSKISRKLSKAQIRALTKEEYRDHKNLVISPPSNSIPRPDKSPIHEISTTVIIPSKLDSKENSLSARQNNINSANYASNVLNKSRKIEINLSTMEVDSKDSTFYSYCNNNNKQLNNLTHNSNVNNHTSYKYISQISPQSQNNSLSHSLYCGDEEIKFSSKKDSNKENNNNKKLKLVQCSQQQQQNYNNSQQKQQQQQDLNLDRQHSCSQGNLIQSYHSTNNIFAQNNINNQQNNNTWLDQIKNLEKEIEILKMENIQLHQQQKQFDNYKQEYYQKNIKDLDIQKKQNDILQIENQKLNSDLNNLQQNHNLEIDEKQHLISILQEENDRFKEQIDGLNTQLIRLNAENLISASSISYNEDNSQQIQSLNQEIRALKNENQELHSKSSNINQDFIITEQKLQKYQLDIQEYLYKISNLECDLKRENIKYASLKENGNMMNEAQIWKIRYESLEQAFNDELKKIKEQKNEYLQKSKQLYEESLINGKLSPNDINNNKQFSSEIILKDKEIQQLKDKNQHLETKQNQQIQEWEFKYQELLRQYNDQKQNISYISSLQNSYSKLKSNDDLDKDKKNEQIQNKQKQQLNRQKEIMKEMEIENFLNREKLENLERQHQDKTKECNLYKEESENLTVLMTHQKRELLQKISDYDILKIKYDELQEIQNKKQQRQKNKNLSINIDINKNNTNGTQNNNENSKDNNNEEFNLDEQDIVFSSAKSSRVISKMSFSYLNQLDNTQQQQQQQQDIQNSFNNNNNILSNFENINNNYNNNDDVTQQQNTKDNQNQQHQQQQQQLLNYMNF